jgi:hypothetical protein
VGKPSQAALDMAERLRNPTASDETQGGNDIVDWDR